MRAVFFDLDGTLVDTRADLAATVNHARRDLALAELSVDEVLSHVGQGARHLLAMAIPECGPNGICPCPEERLWTLFRRRYAEHMLDRCTLYPGVRETLDELARRGWRLGVNTAKPSFATRAILSHFGLDHCFGAAVVAGGDCEEMKPSARPLMACAAKMNGHLPSADDWMVGDSWTDMQCARNAGVKGAFCTFGFGTLRETPVTARIDRFDELLDLLGEEA